jgi:hypothetical protein
MYVRKLVGEREGVSFIVGFEVGFEVDSNEGSRVALGANVADVGEYVADVGVSHESASLVNPQSQVQSSKPSSGH